MSSAMFVYPVAVRVAWRRARLRGCMITLASSARGRCREHNIQDRYLLDWSFLDVGKMKSALKYRPILS
jgi:hypothetical protein